jgi:diguanylate cyclase (GGDEF)-like protein
MQDSLKNLADSEALGILKALRMAGFRWDITSDEIIWAHGAEAVLGLLSGTAPASGRDLQRLFTPATAARRMTAIPALRPSGPAREYDVTMELRAEAAGVEGRLLQETGRWTFDEAGRPVVFHGFLRALDAKPAEAGGKPSGLLTREALLSQLDTVIRDHTQDQGSSSAFMVIAINDLARVNANFGYDVGDRIIAATASRIMRRLRAGDLIGHMSGHKLGAVLRGSTESALSYAAERFRSAVESEPVSTLEAEVQANISIGAVLVPRYAQTADTAAQRAEEALTDARAERGGGLKVYQPSADRDRWRRGNRALAEEIVRGLGGNRFVLAYQPVVDATTRRIISYEALLRLVQDDGKVVSAGPLIATADRLGLTRRLDQRALQLVLGDLAANKGLRLAVNVSVKTLSDPTWIGLLMDAVSATRDIAARLTVEITETTAMGNMDEMLRMSEMLRDIGCRVAIDDFGSGHTSFLALRKLELDWVKIDGSYIKDVATDADSAMFVRTLAKLAHHFGIRVVAEFVQNETTAALLTDAGVQALQGRYFGEPQLRVTPMTEKMLARARPEHEADGYPSYSGLLVGPIELDDAAPVTSGHFSGAS